MPQLLISIHQRAPQIITIFDDAEIDIACGRSSTEDPGDEGTLLCFINIILLSVIELWSCQLSKQNVLFFVVTDLQLKAEILSHIVADGGENIPGSLDKYVQS